jgi:hypothetical protein
VPAFHPNGVVTPSKQDWNAAKVFEDATKTLGIKGSFIVTSKSQHKVVTSFESSFKSFLPLRYLS